MKWFDNWIEKQYLKKHKSEVLQTIPTVSIGVKHLEPRKLQACVDINMMDLDYVDEDTIYEQLLSVMLPQIKQVMDIKYSEDWRSMRVTIHGEIQAYSEHRAYYNWKERIKNCQ